MTPQAYQIERWGARVLLACVFAAVGLFRLAHRLAR